MIIAQNKKNKLSHGFTLVELCIVIVIVGVILSGIAVFLKQYQLEKRYAVLVKKTDRITSALGLYIQDESFNDPDTGAFVLDPNGAQYPCPADPSLGPGDAGYGVEARNTAVTPTRCDDTVLDTSGTGAATVYHGAIPFVTLGIPSTSAIDPRGYKFSYAVSRSVSNGDALMGGAKPLGSITVRRYDSPTTFTPIPDVAFVLVYHGATSLGAWSVAGSEQSCNGAIVGTSERQNCNETSVFTDANDQQNTNSDHNEFYDDIILYTLRGIADKEEYWAHAIDSQDVSTLNPGNVGIGTQTPAEKLHVAGGVQVDNDLSVDEDITGNNIHANNNATVSNNLNVSNSVGIGNNLNVGNNVSADAYLYSSDRRLKENIAEMTGEELQKVLELRMVTYNYIEKPDVKKLGVIAQEIQEIYPELVHKDGEGTLRVDYPGLISPLVRAVQELQKTHSAEIDKLNSRIEELESLIQDSDKEE